MPQRERHRGHILIEVLNIRVHENPPWGCRVETCERANVRTDGERQTDRRKTIVAFRQFANAPKILIDLNNSVLFCDVASDTQIRLQMVFSL